MEHREQIFQTINRIAVPLFLAFNLGVGLWNTLQRRWYYAALGFGFLLLPLLHLKKTTSAVLASLDEQVPEADSTALLDRFQAIIDREYDMRAAFRQAELDAKAKVSDSEVLYAAKEKARQIVARAEDRCRQLYQVTNEYAEDALARTEEAVQMALDEVKQQRVRFRSASAAKMQEQRDKLDGKAPAQEEDDQEG